MGKIKGSRMEPTPTINIDPREIVNCIKLLNEMIADIDETMGLDGRQTKNSNEIDGTEEREIQKKEVQKANRFSGMEPTPTINIDPREIVNCIKLFNEMIADIDETMGLDGRQTEN